MVAADRVAWYQYDRREILALNCYHWKIGSFCPILKETTDKLIDMKESMNVRIMLTSLVGCFLCRDGRGGVV